MVSLLLGDYFVVGVLLFVMFLVVVGVIGVL